MLHSTLVTRMCLLCFSVSISISEGSGNATRGENYPLNPGSSYPGYPRYYGSPLENTELLLAARGGYVRGVYKVKLGEVEIKQVASGDGVTAVDYDFEKKLIVWTDVQDECIYRSREDGDTADNKTFVTGQIVRPDGLSVDWIYGNIYWTDAGTDTINVVSEDGMYRKLLFGTNIEEPRAIVLNPSEGWMFWTDWGSSPKIERSGMDGTHRSTIVSEDIGWPNGLAIDLGSRKIYWADAKMTKISSSDYDGSNVIVVLSSSSSLKHPFGLDVFEDWMFWTDQENGGFLRKANKITGGDTQKVFSNLPWLFGVRVFDVSKQPKGRNYCREAAECSHLCLPAPRVTEDSEKRFTCACPDGMGLTANRKNCTALEQLTTADGIEVEETTVLAKDREYEAVTSFTTNHSHTVHQCHDETTHGIQETGGTCRIARISSGILVGLIIVMKVLGSFTYG